MSIIKYQIFVHTAICGSFTKAAEQLGFTQSGVSHAIASLEDELGLQLMARGRGGVSLTADGRALLPYFEQICAMQHQLEEKAHDLQGLEVGLVRVGTFTSVSIQWMPHILKSFHELYPHIEFELMQGDDSEIERWVSEGRVDCGFISLPGSLKLPAWPLYRDQWKVITACDHPLAGREPFPMQALATQPFIQLDEGNDYEVHAVLDALNIVPNTQYTVREDLTIMAMVSSGLGISVMPELMLQNASYPLAQSHMSQPFYRTIGVCVKDEDACSASTLRFIEHVRHWVGRHYADKNG